MRLIDADAYLKKVCTYNKTGCGSCDLQTKCPNDEPTIDAVPVIRCKDCKHWQCYDDESYCDELGIFNTDMNSYCSYAKRKEK